MTKQSKPKRKGGYRKIYKPALADRLYEHLAQGFCLGSFGYDILGVSDQTIYEWIKKYPEFADARERGYRAGLRWWESLLIFATTGVVPPQFESKGVTKLNMTGIIFTLKTRFHKYYGEVQKMEVKEGLDVDMTTAEKLEMVETYKRVLSEADQESNN